jgi:hypothetical protein
MDLAIRLKNKINNFLDFKTDIIWYIVVQVVILHTVAIYGILTFDYIQNPMTTLWSKYNRPVLYSEISACIYIEI